MSKQGIWLVVGTALVIFGTVILVLTAHTVNWNFNGFSTTVYNDVDQAFDSISINTDTADIEFLPSDNENCRVICYESEKVRHIVSVENDVLTVKVADGRKWYERFIIDFRTPNITVYLPKTEYAALTVENSTGKVEVSKDFEFGNAYISTSTGDVRFCASASKDVEIETRTGDVFVENSSLGSLDVSVTTGKVSVSGVTCEGEIEVEVSTGKTYLTDISCRSVSSEGDTGDIFLSKVIAAKKISVERSTGDVNFELSDAAEIEVETDTGDIEGSLLTDKIFITRTDTGRVRVPDSAGGGRCELTTDTGDIRISILTK